MRIRLFLLISLFLFTFSFISSGQKLVNSPYSRFNIGTMEPAGSFRSLGMGGVSMALRDNTNIFFSNPASYTSFDTTSFLFDFGIDYSQNKLVFGKENHKSDDMNFDHLILGFPVGRGFGIATGIVPISNGYYKIFNTMASGDPGYDPIIGGYTSSHAGEGGLTQAFLGAGLKLHKYLSAGINMTILFGQISRTNNFTFDDAENVFNNNSSEKIQVGGINFDYGLQFTLPLKENSFFNAGISLTGAKKYNTDYENFVFRYTSYGSTDTISYNSGDASQLKLPSSIRFGLAYGQKNKMTIAFDFISTKWSNSIIPGSEGYAADTRTFNLGFEYTPERFSNFSYFRRMDYRLGTHFGDNYLVLNGQQIKEAGITAGLGLPMKRGYLAKANLFIDYTRKNGSAPGGLHTEHYLTAGASINLYDFWFVKRKYD